MEITPSLYINIFDCLKDSNPKTSQQREGSIVPRPAGAVRNPEDRVDPFLNSQVWSDKLNRNSSNYEKILLRYP
jgi:hypothetical protein